MYFATVARGAGQPVPDCAHAGPLAGSAGVDDAVVEALSVERPDSPRDAMREKRGANDNSKKVTEMSVIVPPELCEVDDTGDDGPSPEGQERAMHAGTFQ